MIYAICADSGEILAASWGKRNKAGGQEADDEA